MGGGLFATYRYHAIFTDSQAPMLEAEATHRDHAIIEQTIADLKTPRSRTCPPAGLARTAPGWSAPRPLVRVAHNLTRAAGALAGALHARARTGTLRARLINVAARLARSAGRIVLHLPHQWPWQAGLDELFRRALHDPLPAPA